MAKRGVNEQIKLLKQRQEYESKKAKRFFFVILDIITLAAFVLALYFTYSEDYTKTIIFLVIGTLILMYFIVRGALRKK